MRILIIGSLLANKPDMSATDRDVLVRTCLELGRNIATAGHELLVCSPFNDSADVQVLRGVAATTDGVKTRVRFFLVDSPDIRNHLNNIVKELGLVNFAVVPFPPPLTQGRDEHRYAWLLCQLNALDAADVTIAIGGQVEGAANMLLQLAHGRQRPILPLSFTGGAAQRAYHRCNYELLDKLGLNIAELDPHTLTGRAIKYATILADGSMRYAALNPKFGTGSFFISYSRERATEADYVEALLRRRNLRVFRDESEFGAGHSIPALIREAIFEATIFIALWSAEYACSPWCFDEFELALDRRESGSLQIWVLRLDATRIVPPRARELLHYDVKNRQEIEGKLLDLLTRGQARR